MMHNEWGSGFGAGMAAGVLLIWLLILVGTAIFGHINVDTMTEIQAPTMYKVTVDGIETMCKREPDIKDGYLELIGCTGMPGNAMRVKQYSTLQFEEVR